MTHAPGGGRAVWRALGYLRRYRGETVGAFVSLLLASGASLAAPQMVRLAVDEGLARGSLSVVRATVGGLVAMALVRGFFNFLQGYLAERASPGRGVRLAQRALRAAAALELQLPRSGADGAVAHAADERRGPVRAFVGGGVVQVVASLLMVVGCSGLLFLTNPLLALAALGTIAPVVWVLRQFMGRISPMFGKVQALLGRLNSVLQESLRGIRVVRAFSGEGREAARYGRFNDEFLEHNLQLIRIISSHFPRVGLFANLGIWVVVGLGGWLIFHERLSVGELLAFNSYLGFLFMPLVSLGFLAAQMSRAGVSAVRIFELLDTAVEVVDRPGARSCPP
ncbi:ABC transporter transmembrane domain-containing protein [Cystobacter fuscus]